MFGSNQNTTNTGFGFGTNTNQGTGTFGSGTPGTGAGAFGTNTAPSGTSIIMKPKSNSPAFGAASPFGQRPNTGTLTFSLTLANSRIIRIRNDFCIQPASAKYLGNPSVWIDGRIWTDQHQYSRCLWNWWSYRRGSLWYETCNDGVWNGVIWAWDRWNCQQYYWIWNYKSLCSWWIWKLYAPSENFI
jgi:hypothetical protein